MTKTICVELVSLEIFHEILYAKLFPLENGKYSFWYIVNFTINKFAFRAKKKYDRQTNHCQFLKTCFAFGQLQYSHVWSKFVLDNLPKAWSIFVLDNLPATKSMCTLHSHRSHSREVKHQEWFVLYENINSQGLKGSFKVANCHRYICVNKLMVGGKNCGRTHNFGSFGIMSCLQTSKNCQHLFSRGCFSCQCYSIEKLIKWVCSGNSRAIGRRWGDPWGWQLREHLGEERLCQGGVNITGIINSLISILT